MKCYKCVHINKDKNKDEPCINCTSRPLDLCCSDNFEKITIEPMQAEDWMEYNYAGAETEIKQYTWHEMINAFEHGEQNQKLRYKPLIDAIKELYIKVNHDRASILAKKIFDEYDNIVRSDL